MERLATRIVLLVVAAIATVAIVAVAPDAIRDRAIFGTVATTGAPPRVDYCGRTYDAGIQTESLAQLNSFLAGNHLAGLQRIGTAPSGMPIVANLMSAAARAHYHTDVCTMVLWVQTGHDAYVGYGLSGGP